MLRLACVGLLLSCGLGFLTQQPVLPKSQPDRDVSANCASPLSGTARTHGITYQLDASVWQRYSVMALMIQQRGAFPADSRVVRVALGVPNCHSTSSGFELNFYKVGFDRDGAVIATGIGTAVSEDGAQWELRADQPVSIYVVGTSQGSTKVVDELKGLVAAYSDPDDKPL